MPDKRPKKTNRSNQVKEGKFVESVKELTKRATISKEGNTKNLSPVEKALKRFEQDNGYDFLDMITQPKIRNKHSLRQHQIPENDDNDFLEDNQNKQGN